MHLLPGKLNASMLRRFTTDSFAAGCWSEEVSGAQPGAPKKRRAWNQGNDRRTKQRDSPTAFMFTLEGYQSTKQGHALANGAA